MWVTQASLLKRSGFLNFSFCAMLLTPVVGVAQEVSDSNPNQTIHLRMSKADKIAPSLASQGFKHMIVPRVGYGMRRNPKEIALPALPQAPAGASSKEGAKGVPSSSYYPGDLSNPYEGEVITEMTGHPVYVNTEPAAVGYPGTLLKDLQKSDLVHVLDQYVGRTTANRYRVGLGALVIDPTSGPIYDSDIQTIVHAAATLFGQTGHRAEYHVFFGSGQDVCFDATSGVCYSPDNFSTFLFCAYHSSTVFSDIGEVIYSVIPYQAVGGCEVGSPSPNGLVVDSTMSVLSHEYAESITDPDGTGWWNRDSLDLFGYEIGDICQNTTFVYPVVKLNGKPYELQAEYSNKSHACSYVP